MTYTRRERIEFLLNGEDGRMAELNERLAKQHDEQKRAGVPPRLRDIRGIPATVDVDDVFEAMGPLNGEDADDPGFRHLVAMLVWCKIRTEDKENRKYRNVAIISTASVRAALNVDEHGIVKFWEAQGLMEALDYRDDIGEFSVL